jgi:hypothetical protein
VVPSIFDSHRSLLHYSSPQGVLHSVLSCRLILHMYDFGRKEVMATQETGTALEFATVDAGNRDANRSTDSETSRNRRTGRLYEPRPDVTG